MKLVLRRRLSLCPILRALFLLLLLPLGDALAAPFGTVERLLVLDNRGQWSATTSTGLAIVQQGDAENTLSLGMALAVGNRVATRNARVILRLESGGQMNIYQDTEVTLEAGGVLQSIGRIFYRLRSHFTVRYANVETVVEGTSFLVDIGDERFLVEVEEGQVTVHAGEASEAVTAGRRATVRPTTSGQTTNIEVSADHRDMESLVRKAFGVRPHVLVGMTTGPGAADGLAGNVRLLGNMHLGSTVRLGLDTGVLFGSGESRFPQALGLGIDLGSVTVSPVVMSSFHRFEDTCGTQRVILHFGGAVDVRGQIPLPGNLLFLAGVRAGALAGDIPFLDGTFGLGVEL